jgi:hypothetical protein
MSGFAASDVDVCIERSGGEFVGDDLITRRFE